MIKITKALYTIELPNQVVIELTLEEMEELYRELKRVLPDQLINTYLYPQTTVGVVDASKWKDWKITY